MIDTVMSKDAFRSALVARPELVQALDVVRQTVSAMKVSELEPMIAGIMATPMNWSEEGEQQAESNYEYNMALLRMLTITVILDRLREVDDFQTTVRKRASTKTGFFVAIAGYIQELAAKFESIERRRSLQGGEKVEAVPVSEGLRSRLSRRKVSA